MNDYCVIVDYGTEESPDYGTHDPIVVTRSLDYDHAKKAADALNKRLLRTATFSYKVISHNELLRIQLRETQ